MINIEKKTAKTAFIAIGCVVAVALSFLESLIPQLAFMPPGAKIGLSNIVTMLTSFSAGLLPSLGIVAVKALFVGITRGATAFFMSLSGGLFSTMIAYLLIKAKKKKNNISYIFIGIASAVAHNTAQLAVACIVISYAIYYYIPFLILFSLLTGSLTGMVFKIVLPSLRQINIDVH